MAIPTVLSNLRRGASACAAVAAALSLAACVSLPLPPAATRESARSPGTMRPYEVGGRWYYPAIQPHYQAVGYASWYGDGYGCQVTADGEAMNPHAITGAHRTLPLPSIVEVKNLANGRKIRVRINDRGPFVEGRIIDLTPAAAKKLGFYSVGVARVRVRYLGRADPRPAVRDAAWRPFAGGCR